MTIRFTGEPLDSDQLKAALAMCETCGESSLYLAGLFSGESAKFVADLHDVTTRSYLVEHSIVIKGYKVGDPWPEKDINNKTKFFKGYDSIFGRRR